MARTRTRPTADWKTPRLKGKTFCFDGKLTCCQLKDATALIKSEGGRVVKTVTEKLDYMVIGERRRGESSTAEKKVESLNEKKQASIQILDESDFHQLFAPDRETAIAMLKAGKAGIERWNATLGHDWLQVSVDLSRADFHGCNLSGADLTLAKLASCDFRESKLDGTVIGAVRNSKFDDASGRIKSLDAARCSFKNADFRKCSSLRATNSNFEGACLANSRISQLKGCTARRTDLTNVRFVHSWYGLRETNFTGAKMVRTAGEKTMAERANFDNADLRKSKLERCYFGNSSFREADLSGANLRGSYFTTAVLSGANLENTELTGAHFKNADLTNASFRGAVLASADFTDAIVDGADFQDANVTGVVFSDDQISKAKGLATAAKAAGSVGPNVRELERIAGQCNKLITMFQVDLDDGSFVRVSLISEKNIFADTVRICEDFSNGSSHFHKCGQKPYSQCLLTVAERWRQGQPRFHSITVKATSCPLKSKELRQLVIAAWCEVFGMDPLSEDELKQQKKQAAADTTVQRDAALAELRSGTKGVKKWNKLTEKERLALGRMRRVDLSGINLSSANFEKCDLQGANLNGCQLKKGRFKRADLRKAHLDNVQANGANFNEAKLTDASFRESVLRNCFLSCCSLARTSFAGADLTGASCGAANLRGADFTDATLVRTDFDESNFDEHTKFPKDFKLPQGLIWKGAGKDPRLVEKIEQVQKTGPVDFETFMERLEENFDAARLKKALKMLKAESFQLFAQVEENSVTGVVKSQTDPDLVYSCRLDSEGTFACCTQNLNPCGGLRGALCKHLLVLIVGLTKGDELDATSVNGWVAASRLQSPKLDKELISEVFLRYKGAEAGEIDWRPTETVPEDYYAF